MQNPVNQAQAANDLEPELVVFVFDVGVVRTHEAVHIGLRVLHVLQRFGQQQRRPPDVHKLAYLRFGRHGNSARGKVHDLAVQLFEAVLVKLVKVDFERRCMAGDQLLAGHFRIHPAFRQADRLGHDRAGIAIQVFDFFEQHLQGAGRVLQRLIAQIMGARDFGALGFILNEAVQQFFGGANPGIEHQDPRHIEQGVKNGQLDDVVIVANPGNSGHRIRHPQKSTNAHQRQQRRDAVEEHMGGAQLLAFGIGVGCAQNGRQGAAHVGANGNGHRIVVCQLLHAQGGNHQRQHRRRTLHDDSYHHTQSGVQQQAFHSAHRVARNIHAGLQALKPRLDIGNAEKNQPNAKQKITHAFHRLGPAHQAAQPDHHDGHGVLRNIDLDAQGRHQPHRSHRAQIGAVQHGQPRRQRHQPRAQKRNGQHAHQGAGLHHGRSHNAKNQAARAGLRHPFQESLHAGKQLEAHIKKRHAIQKQAHPANYPHQIGVAVHQQADESQQNKQHFGVHCCFRLCFLPSIFEATAISSANQQSMDEHVNVRPEAATRLARD